jgi:folate-binding protein YgfZ
MFVMRAKVKLTDASHVYALTGFIGPAAAIVSPSIESEVPWHVLALSDGHAHLLNLYPARAEAGNVPRALLISDISQGFPNELATASLENLSESDWQLAEVLSGISMVQSATSEAFVPQMLNYESVNGVSFKKGCYPGQEVVARSQFRGTLKRRAYVVSSDSPLIVGQEIFAADDETQSCGKVSSAAVYVPTGSSRPESYWGIVSMQTSAADQSLHMGSSQGPRLNVHALPYPLLEDI